MTTEQTIYNDALEGYKNAKTNYGRYVVVAKGLKLLEDRGYHGFEIDILAQLVIEARAKLKDTEIGTL